VGYNALNLTTGGSNTALGEEAGDTLTTGTNNTLIGYNAQPSSATVSNEITLGNASVNKVRMGNGDVIYGGAIPTFRAYPGGGTNQSISPSTYTKVNLGVESWDTNSNFDTTLSRFTPTVAGYYQVNASILWDHFAQNASVALTVIYKNGSSNAVTEWANWSFGSGNSIKCQDIFYMNGTTDYIEMYGYSNASSPTIERNSANTYFSAILVRAA